MGSSLGPVLANVLMTEFEKVVVQKLVDNGTLPFYIRYVDDTLVLMKPEDINTVLKTFNEFTKGIRFTLDLFSDNDVHFLDLSINPVNLETNIYSKPTNTGQYIHYESFTPWRFKVAWIKSLYERGRKLCSTEALFEKHLAHLKKLMSWNGFSRHVRSSILKRMSHNSSTNTDNVTEVDNMKMIWIRLPYMGKQGEMITKTLLRKLKRCFKTAVKFKVLYDTRKVSSFCSTKDKIPSMMTSNVIYKIDCPGCGKQYIGKSERCFGVRLECQGTRDNEPMYLHLRNCSKFHDTCNMLVIDDNQNSQFEFNIVNYIYHAILNNAEILKRHNNPNELAFMEAYFIKLLNPAINVGIAASKELVLFR